MKHAVSVLKALVAAYVVTAVFLLLLSLLLYRCGLGEGQVTAGIIVIYVLSTFAGGFFAGKLMKEKKFLWGLVTGLTYFLLLVIVSMAVFHSLSENGTGIVTSFLLCTGGGMLGGMLS